MNFADVLSQELLHQVVGLLVRLVEAAGALIVFTGAAWAFVRFLWRGISRSDGGTQKFTSVRLELGLFLALGLEFQLAGDILRTAVAPTFAEIGQLAAIAAIRTALNYFLAKEMEKERGQLRERQHTRGRGSSVS